MSFGIHRRHHASRLAFAITLLSTGAAAVAAQVPIGGRIRVEVAADSGPRRSVTGTLQRIGSDSLWLLAGNRELVLPLRIVAGLEHRRTHGSHWAEGAAIGAVLGLGVGLLVDNRVCSGSGERPACVANGRLLFGGIGTAVGALSGGFLGSARPRTRWEPVPRSTWQVSAGASHRWLRMTLSWTP